jgi:hypothetical protein
MGTGMVVFDIAVGVAVAAAVVGSMVHRRRNEASEQPTPEALAEQEPRGSEVRLTPGINPTGGGAGPSF